MSKNKRTVHLSQYRSPSQRRADAKRLASAKLSAGEYKRGISKLEKAGLVQKGASRAPTRSGIETIKQYRDVIEGRAHVVKAPRSVREKYKSTEKRPTIRVKGDRIVIPKKVKGERVHLTKKGTISVTRREYGRTTRAEIGGFTDLHHLRAFEADNPNRYTYTISIRRGRFTEHFRFPTVERLENFLGRSTKIWEKRDVLAGFVEAELRSGDDDYSDEEE